MALNANNTHGFTDAHASAPDLYSDIHPHLTTIRFSIATAIATSLLLKIIFGRSLVNVHGNGIPRGPWGLPIVGQSKA